MLKFGLLCRNDKNNCALIGKIFIIYSFLLLPFAGNAGGRTVENFNFGWKFQLGEVENGESPALDDSAWRAVDLPHDFQVEQPWMTPDTWGEGSDNENPILRRRSMARGFKAMGSGWYRKAFTLGPASSKRYILEFEGIMLVGDVWLNGKKIGGTDYGYSGFEIDITNELKQNEPNILAVRANTGRLENSRWYTGGGIYRNVNLLIKDARLSFARHAISITTPRISATSATINLQAEVQSRLDNAAEAKVEVRVFDPEGKEVANAITKLSLSGGNRTSEHPLTEMEVKLPRLWSCETPHLYRAEIALFDENGNVTDHVAETFGIRSIAYSSEFGFKLNGEKVLLKGIANHHELGALGAAAYDRAIEKRFQLLKSFGINHVRCSHNPYSKEFYRLADKYGILVVDETFDKWSRNYAGGRTDWWNLWPYVVTEMVKSGRNHPSIIMWSLGNELQVNESWAGYPATGDFGVTPYHIQNALVKRYNSTRPTTVAMFPRRRPGADLPPQLAVETEIASFNYTYKDFRRDSKTFPDMIFYQSEASVNDMGTNYYGMALDSVIGLAYWGAIDYLGESHGWPDKGWRRGVFNIDLSPKPQAFLLKSMFTEEPVVHIAIIEEEKDFQWNDVNVGSTSMADHWNHPKGSIFKLLTYTNADEVELLINGRSLGRQSNQKGDIELRNRVRWENIAYEKGNITAVAYNNGKEVARHRVETTGKPVKLVVEPDNEPWLATGLDVKHVRVYAVDSKGRRVPEANQLLTFEVEGDARVVAVDNGDLASDELHTGNQRSLYRGTALVILRSGKTAGEVTLEVSGEGFRSVKTKITIEAVQ